MTPVYFYGTCMLDMLSPYTGYHIVRLLEEAGCRVLFPTSQTCCGQPAYNSGYREEAHRVALTQLEIFPEDYPILLPSGSCASMIKHHYHDLFSEEEVREKVDSLSRRVEEWSRFYLGLNPQFSPADHRGEDVPIRVAWHGSCHSLREMRIGEEPLTLLKKLPGVEVVELVHQRECCGFGGTFAVKYADISAVMAENKCNEIIDTGATALVSSDIGCMTHILSRMKKLGKALPGYHLSDFLALRLGLAHPDFGKESRP